MFVYVTSLLEKIKLFKTKPEYLFMTKSFEQPQELERYASKTLASEKSNKVIATR